MSGTRTGAGSIDQPPREDAGAPAAQPPAARHDEQRVRALLDAHFVFIWRLLRRLGVAEGDVDDVTQQVFILASKKLASIAPGSERSFLFGIALRVASEVRRSVRRRGEVDAAPLALLPDEEPLADEALAQRQNVALLDRIIESMPDDLRLTFVLCEIEELGVPEAAALQQIPTGTAASRLRRARKYFNDQARRVFMSTRGPRRGDT